MFKRLLLLSFLFALFSISFITAQVLPNGVTSSPFVCPPPENQVEATSEEAKQEQDLRAAYRKVLPAYLEALKGKAPESIPMPIQTLKVRDVADTWGAARSNGRRHEGQDLFAERGTPVHSATAGYIYRMGQAPLGGNIVTVVGAGGYRYYYAHLDSFSPFIEEGQFVTQETLLGFVGNTGNAINTPPHLHFGIYLGDENPCSWNAINPYPLLTDR